MMREHPAGERRIRERTYVIVWLALLALTAVTVTVAAIDLGSFSILVALAVAGLKSALVGAFFMHLGYEKSRLYLMLLLVALATLGISMGLTFADIMNRY